MSAEHSYRSVIFRVKKHLLEMLRDRGYDISNEDPLFAYSLNDFVQVYQTIARESGIDFLQALNSYYERPSDGSLISVYFPKAIEGKKSLGKDQVREIVEEIKASRINHSIIVSSKPVSSDARKELDNIPLYRIELFLYRELTYNPTKHFLVPRHEIISKDDAAAFLKRSGLSIDRLPKISYLDPIIRYYGGRPGQLVKIYSINIAQETIETMVTEAIRYRAITKTPLSV